MNAYLTWEIELANQIKRDDTVAFGVGEAIARIPGRSLRFWHGARRSGAAARSAAAAAMRGLRCAGGCAGPALRRLLPPDRLHHRAVLRALRRAVRQRGAGWRGPSVSRAADAAPPVFRRARAALRYDAQGRRLILPFKHADGTELAAVAGAAHGARRRGAAARGGVLVPVPLHRARLFHRRYNQAALLAQAVGRIAGRPCVAGRAGAAARHCVARREVRRRARGGGGGAFAVRASRAARVVGKRVLLVDDVMTSGATANACAGALLAAGATSVDVLVAARVPDPRLN